MSASKDDGSGNGFTDGSAAYFEVWDQSTGHVHTALESPSFTLTGLGLNYVDLDIDYSQYNPLVSMHQSYSEKSFFTHQRKILSPHYISNYYNILYDILQSFIGLRPQIEALELNTRFLSTALPLVNLIKKKIIYVGHNIIRVGIPP